MALINITRMNYDQNIKLGHSIPLKTLVEVDIEYSDHHGIRGYVCEHTRDCDGTPLYALYYSNDFDTLDYVRENERNLYRYMIVDGFGEDCLKVIR